MATMRLMLMTILAATLVGSAASLAQTCRPMESSAVGVDTGMTDMLPQRCDEPGKCRIFDMSGRPIGEPGDFVVPRAASAIGLIAVETKKSGLQGYMNADGTWKVEPRFKRAGPYCGDRAAVQRVDSLWVYIDREGQEVGGPWDGAEAFTEGRGLVTSYKGGDKFLHGYIDTAGKVVIPVQFAGARLFSEGLAAVLVGGKWGYIDRDGKMAIPPRFAEAEAFRGGAPWCVSVPAGPGMRPNRCDREIRRRAAIRADQRDRRIVSAASASPTRPTIAAAANLRYCRGSSMQRDTWFQVNSTMPSALWRMG